MKNIIKEQVRNQLKGKQALFFGLLITINFIMIGFRVFSYSLSDSTSFTVALATNVISLAIALINGLAWIIFIRTVRNQSIKLKDLDITFNKALYLMLTAFIMDFLVVGASFLVLMLTAFIPGIGAFIYLFISAMISILVIPINGYLAFQVNDGEYKVFTLFKRAFSLLKSNVNDAIRCVLPYYIFVLLISFISSSVYLSIFTSADITNIYHVIAAFTNNTVALPQLSIAIALELISIVGGAYFLMRVYLGLGNLYEMITTKLR